MTYPLDEMSSESSDIKTRFEGNFAQGAAQGAGTFIHPAGITAGKSTHSLTHSQTTRLRLAYPLRCRGYCIEYQ